MTEAESAEAWVAVVADDVIAAVLLIALCQPGLSARRVETCTAMTRARTADAPQAVVLGLPACAGHLPLTCGR